MTSSLLPRRELPHPPLLRVSLLRGMTALALAFRFLHLIISISTWLWGNSSTSSTAAPSAKRAKVEAPTSSRSSASSSGSSSSSAAASKRPAWDIKGRVQDLEALSTSLQSTLHNNNETIEALRHQLVRSISLFEWCS